MNLTESHVGLPIDFLIDLLIIVLDPKKRLKVAEESFVLLYLKLKI